MDAYQTNFDEESGRLVNSVVEVEDNVPKTSLKTLKTLFVATLLLAAGVIGYTKATTKEDLGYFSALQTSGSFTMQQAGGFGHPAPRKQHKKN